MLHGPMTAGNSKGPQLFYVNRRPRRLNALYSVVRMFPLQLALLAVRTAD